MFRALLFNILILLVLGGVCIASESTLLDNYGKEKPKSFLPDNKLNDGKQLNTFSLRTDMQFRGEQVIKETKTYNFININSTPISYQKGRNNYVLPYSKNVILSKITFNPGVNSRPDPR